MFTQPGPGRPIKYTKELVEPLAAKATNYYELALALGLGWKSTYSTQPQVRAILRRVGVEVPHFVRKKPGSDYQAVPRPPKPEKKTGRPEVCSRLALETCILDGAKSVAEIATRLGIGRHAVYSAFKRFGILKPLVSPVPTKYHRELVEFHAARSDSFYSLALAIGCTSQGTAKKAVKRFGIDVSHFKRKTYVYRSDRIHWRFGKFGQTGVPKTFEEILVLGPVGTRRNGDTLKSALLWSGRTYKCEVCGLPPEWNGKKLRLQVDHVNGLSHDDRAENLRFTCPNCHSQTDTFCGKNIRKRSAKRPDAGPPKTDPLC
jgi:transposase/5-methylcytosine-specific restriction endonuclease McrA